MYYYYIYQEYNEEQQQLENASSRSSLFLVIMEKAAHSSPTRPHNSHLAPAGLLLDEMREADAIAELLLSTVALRFRRALRASALYGTEARKAQKIIGDTV